MAGRVGWEEEEDDDDDDVGRVFVTQSGEVKGVVAPVSVSEKRDARSLGAAPKV